ncbi:MAG: hypothetical protein KBD21_00920 [Candidatus Pacebacteria bacterium]|nr:hypothetical protein [Candidatus Paceibacterota bacterium]
MYCKFVTRIITSVLLGFLLLSLSGMLPWIIPLAYATTETSGITTGVAEHYASPSLLTRLLGILIGFRKNFSLVSSDEQLAAVANYTTGTPLASKFRGVSAAHLEVKNAKGISYGNTWIKYYHDPLVKTQVLKEMTDIKNTTRANLVVFFFTAVEAFTWPSPTTQELTNFANLITDVAAIGLKPSFYIGNPGSVSNDAFKKIDSRVHIGGSKKGSIVNGVQLYWDVPLYAESTYLAQAKKFYGTLYTKIKSASLTGSVGFFGLAGNYYLPFSTEFLLLDDVNVANETKYINALLLHLRGIDANLPISITTLPRTWDPSRAFNYITTLKNGVDINLLTYLDVSSYYDLLDFDQLEMLLGAPYMQKVIVSDFKITLGKNQGVLREHNIAWHTYLAQKYRLAGWWLWDYRADVADGDGVRDSVANGNDWKTDAIRAMKSDYAKPLLTGTPDVVCVSSCSLKVYGENFIPGISVLEIHTTTGKIIASRRVGVYTTPKLLEVSSQNQTELSTLKSGDFRVRVANGGVFGPTSLIFANAHLEEVGANNVPSLWSVGVQPGAPVFVLTSLLDSSAQDGARSARASGQGGSDYWMWVENSDKISTQGLSSVTINGYVRSNMRTVALGIKELDSSGNVLRQQLGPNKTTPVWQWYEYKSLAGAATFTLLPGTKSITIYALAQLPTNAVTAYLDIDNVSAQSIPLYR